MLKVTHLVHRYPDGRRFLTALSVPHLEAYDGEAWCITGPSGSGKSTFLHCLSGLLRPTEGDISYKGRSLTLDMSDADLDVFRGRTIGCLYQKFNLLPFLSARDNILLGAHFGGVPKKEAEARLSALAEKMGLMHLLSHYPNELSQGEEQRTALARALIKEPPILLADEPTGALDYNTGRQILKLLQETCRKDKMTVVLITHNGAITPMADHIIRMKSGKIVEDIYNENPKNVEEIEW